MPGAIAQSVDEAILRLDWARDPKKLQAAVSKFESHEPFRVFTIDDFLDESLLSSLESELEDQLFYVKENDLFSFLQSGDLEQSDCPTISKVKKALYSSEFRSVLESLSSLKLNDTIDMTASVYQRTNQLLCHDDRLLARRIAYILYLVPDNWTAENDGGCLDLFECNEANEPVSIVKSLAPKRNRLLMFQVSERSFHQVAEVLSHDKRRLSLHGWFHGEPLESSPQNVAEKLGSFSAADRHLLSSWVAPEYLDDKSLEPIREQLFEESCVELANFLLPARFNEIRNALQNEQQFAHVGPYNKRCYGVARDLCEPLQTLMNDVVLSDAMSRYLTMLSGELQLLSRGAELRRFGRGCYTLAHDDEPESKEVGLDVTLCLADGNDTSDASAWEKYESGGALVYVDEGESEPLVTVPVHSNALSIVFRSEPGTMRFVKYVSQDAPGSRYDIAMVCRVEPVIYSDSGSEAAEPEHDNADVSMSEA